QPLVAFNPDPQRIDGVLIPFPVARASEVLHDVLDAMFQVRRLTLGKATLNDGQKLYAVNDLFIGQRTQVSAYYSIRLGDRQEDHWSSGIIVSTGAGSTGWLRAVLAGAAGVMEQLLPAPSASVSYVSRRAQPPESAAPSPVEQVRNAYAF